MGLFRLIIWQDHGRVGMTTGHVAVRQQVDQSWGSPGFLFPDLYPDPGPYKTSHLSWPSLKTLRETFKWLICFIVQSSWPLKVAIMQLKTQVKQSHWFSQSHIELRVKIPTQASIPLRTAFDVLPAYENHFNTSVCMCACMRACVPMCVQAWRLTSLALLCP